MKKLMDCIKESLIGDIGNKIFVIIKPGFLNLSQKIQEYFDDFGYSIKQCKAKKLLLSEAEELYKIHEDEDFYDSLCAYMSSDVSIAFIMEKRTFVNDVFKEVGKIKDELRNKYGESEMRNVLHSSDSLEHMLGEYKVYFNNI